MPFINNNEKISAPIAESSIISEIGYISDTLLIIDSLESIPHLPSHISTCLLIATNMEELNIAR